MAAPNRIPDVDYFAEPPLPEALRQDATILAFPQPEDIAPQAVFVPADMLPPGAPEDLTLPQFVMALQARAERARDGLSAVIANEPRRVPKGRADGLAQNEFTNLPSYILGCWRYSRNYAREERRKDTATRGLQRAEWAARLSGVADSFLLEPSSFQPEAPVRHPHDAYLRHIAASGLKHWLKARLA